MHFKLSVRKRWWHNSSYHNHAPPPFLASSLTPLLLQTISPPPHCLLQVSPFRLHRPYCLHLLMIVFGLYVYWPRMRLQWRICWWCLCQGNHIGSGWWGIYQLGVYLGRGVCWWGIWRRVCGEGANEFFVG